MEICTCASYLDWYDQNLLHRKFFHEVVMNVVIDDWDMVLPEF